ncbi:MAG: hypothetical protein ACE5GK_00845 [Nitrospiria bacterium]
MRNPFKFFAELMKQPVWISVWVFFLTLINLVSAVYWPAPLAKLIFTVFIISAMLMMTLYSLFGFEKILGLGHILWIPLLIYVLMKIPGRAGSFKSYLIVLSTCIAISLAIDMIDVWKYLTGRQNT